MRSCFAIGPFFHHSISGLKMSSLQPDTKFSATNVVCASETLAIRVLLPAIQFVVDSQGYTFLETPVRVRGPTNDVTLELANQSSDGQKEKFLVEAIT